jgi:hypothetical protein
MPRSRLAAVVGVDADVIVRQIAGPDCRLRRAAAQVDTDRYLGLLHHLLALRFAVSGVPTTAHDDMHIVEKQVDQALVQIGDAGVAHRRQDAPEIGVTGKEGRLHQR